MGTYVKETIEIIIKYKIKTYGHIYAISFNALYLDTKIADGPL